VQHALICTDGSLLIFAALQLELGLEGLALARGQLELDGGDHFSGTLTGPEIADGELAGIRPIGVDGRIHLMRRDLHQVFQHSFRFRFADTFEKRLEGLVVRSLRHEPVQDAIDRLRDSLGGHGTDCQAICAGVFCPLAAKDDLEVRNIVFVLVPADAVEPEICNVMLSAGIEAAANLDP
jgi:hypothetical protein